jgi:hypothetical protein
LHATLGIGHKDADGRAIGQQAKSLFAGAQCLLGKLAISNVFDRADPGADAEFYRPLRLVTHIDDRAIAFRTLAAQAEWVQADFLIRIKIC